MILLSSGERPAGALAARRLVRLNTIHLMCRLQQRVVMLFLVCNVISNNRNPILENVCPPQHSRAVPFHLKLFYWSRNGKCNFFSRVLSLILVGPNRQTMRHRLIFIIDLSRALVTRLSFLLTQFPSVALRCCCVAGYKTEYVELLLSITSISDFHRNIHFLSHHRVDSTCRVLNVIIKTINNQQRRRKNCWAEGRCSRSNESVTNWTSSAGFRLILP